MLKLTRKSIREHEGLLAEVNHNGDPGRLCVDNFDDPYVLTVDGSVNICVGDTVTIYHSPGLDHKYVGNKLD